MPPILKTAPTPKAFADAWSRELESVLKKAAGKDGKVSRTEASRLKESARSRASSPMTP